MSHRYWETDTPQRHEYFVEQFLSLAKELAKQRKVPTASILGQVKDETSFEATLEEVMSLDSSLLEYVGNLSPEALKDFFNMPKIQDLVGGNIPPEEEIPVEVVQEEGEPVELFTAYVDGKKVLAEKMTLPTGQEVYRTATGQFASPTKEASLKSFQKRQEREQAAKEKSLRNLQTTYNKRVQAINRKRVSKKEKSKLIKKATEQYRAERKRVEGKKINDNA